MNGSSSVVGVQARSPAVAVLIVAVLAAMAMLVVVIAMHATSVVRPGVAGQRSAASQTLPAVRPAVDGQLSQRDVGVGAFIIATVAAVTVVSTAPGIDAVIPGWARCTLDSAVVATICGLLLTVTAIVLLGKSRALNQMRRRPSAIAARFRLAALHSPRPSLTVLSISRT
jgi:hypothetical protein